MRNVLALAFLLAGVCLAADRPDTLSVLVAELDADDFASRERATAWLLQSDGESLPQVFSALEAAESPEVKARLSRIIVSLTAKLLKPAHESAANGAFDEAVRRFDQAEERLKKFSKAMAGTPAGEVMQKNIAEAARYRKLALLAQQQDKQTQAGVARIYLHLKDLRKRPGLDGVIVIATSKDIRLYRGSGFSFSPELGELCKAMCSIFVANNPGADGQIVAEKGAIILRTELELVDLMDGFMDGVTKRLAIQAAKEEEAKQESK